MTAPKLSAPIISIGELTTGSDEDVSDVDLEGSGAEFELRTINVPLESHGARLDLALVQMVPEFSRSYLQQLIAAGAVQQTGLAVTKASSRVKAGDKFSIELRPTLQSQAFQPEAMDLEVLFEDAYLMVINKPAGLVVHPAPGNWSGTLLNGLLAHDTQAALLPRAGIVHRLDKDTSGLMVIARHRQTMDQLVAMIAARTVSREYLALAHGSWQGSTTRQVNFPVGRDPRNRLKMAVVDLDKTPGKAAATDISVLDNTARHCAVRCKLHTGRTHQIRVHMAAIGHPLVADAAYGGQADGGLERQALHAWRLAFKHPVTGIPLSFDSLPPPDLQSASALLGLRYNLG